VHDSVD
jgi:dynein heavy chain, axonemal